MAPRALHAELPGHDGLAVEVFSRDPAALAEVEAHVAAGCSPCARALVNARDAAVTVAEGAAPTPPPATLRERLLSSARGALAPRQGSPPRRFFDPAGELARLHALAPDDVERTREVDDLGVASPPAGDACGALLAQIQGLLGFPLLFVSVIRGDRCGYRAQIGLEALAAAASRDRRRETTFCTHTVSTDDPMLVPDAAREPFFARSPMVRRDGIRAYAGVPLRTSRGIVVGTVCAMDFVPRPLGPEVVRTLELYALPLVAEIEGRGPRTASGALLHPALFFGALTRVPFPEPGALLVARPGQPGGPGAETLADLARPGEIAGRIAGAAVGLLLPRRHPACPLAAERLAEVQAAMGPGITVALSSAA